MKNELINAWYQVTFTVTENNDRREYSMFSQGDSDTAAAVSAAVSICEGRDGLSNPTFKSIRIDGAAKEATEIDDDEYATECAEIASVIRELLSRRQAACEPQNTPQTIPNKTLEVSLPDSSSKAFWSSNGKCETFHPETYKRWVKDAIERACTIAGIEVRVK